MTEEKKKRAFFSRRFEREEARSGEDIPWLEVQLVGNYRRGGRDPDGGVDLADAPGYHPETKKNVQTRDERIGALGGQRRSIFNVRRDLGLHVGQAQ